MSSLLFSNQAQNDLGLLCESGRGTSAACDPAKKPPPIKTLVAEASPSSYPAVAKGRDDKVGDADEDEKEEQEGQQNTRAVHDIKEGRTEPEQSDREPEVEDGRDGEEDDDGEIGVPDYESAAHW